MKQVTNMSRLVNQLEKMFKELNKDFFNNELATPIITCIPSTKSYAHYVPADIWTTKDTSRREINIASGTLDRPLELITASLIHEMYICLTIPLKTFKTHHAGKFITINCSPKPAPIMG